MQSPRTWMFTLILKVGTTCVRTYQNCFVRCWTKLKKSACCRWLFPLFFFYRLNKRIFLFLLTMRMESALITLCHLKFLATCGDLHLNEPSVLLVPAQNSSSCLRPHSVCLNSFRDHRRCGICDVDHWHGTLMVQLESRAIAPNMVTENKHIRSRQFGIRKFEKETEQKLAQ